MRPTQAGESERRTRSSSPNISHRTRSQTERLCQFLFTICVSPHIVRQLPRKSNNTSETDEGAHRRMKRQDDSTAEQQRLCVCPHHLWFHSSPHRTSKRRRTKGHTDKDDTSSLSDGVELLMHHWCHAILGVCRWS